MRSPIDLIEQFAGQEIPFAHNANFLGLDSFPDGGVGYSQLNEILLTLGYDRVSRDFFTFVFGDRHTISNVSEFADRIDHFRKLAMLRYGNIKYAFKHLADKDTVYINSQLASYRRISEDAYIKRHPPVSSLEYISPEDAYYLGYLIEKQLLDEKASRVSIGQPISDIERRLNQMKAFRDMGERNFSRYLTYDHMDVYVATSMREAHEFYSISRFVRLLFGDESLRDLKLRWFDPTQAYVPDRIDKGLVEALMLRRARCTVYHAQEADTFGKDSELAGTLAQGKPVVVYVPSIDNRLEFRRWLQDMIRIVYPGKNELEILRESCRHYYPAGVWENPRIRDWVGGTPIDVDEAYELIFEGAKALYDRRAETLQNHHPLGLQVKLDTGVANGVLVVRKIAQCALLVRKILLRGLEFDIEETHHSWLLRERISRSAYRVVTKNELLTNSFWNFYVTPEPEG